MQNKLKQLMSEACDEAAKVANAEDLDAFVDKTIIALESFRTAVKANCTDDEIVEYYNDSVMNKHIVHIEIDFN